MSHIKCLQIVRIEPLLFIIHRGYEDDMELTELIGSIQSTSLLLESATDPFRESKEFAAQSLIKSVEDVYMEVMKPLQFGKHQLNESVSLTNR